MSRTRRQIASAHASHAYHCECGRVVWGNGAKAMHFYVQGNREYGKRDGHRLITRERYLDLHGHPLDHPLNRRARHS